MKIVRNVIILILTFITAFFISNCCKSTAEKEPEKVEIDFCKLYCDAVERWANECGRALFPKEKCINSVNDSGYTSRAQDESICWEKLNLLESTEYNCSKVPAIYTHKR